MLFLQCVFNLTLTMEETQGRKELFTMGIHAKVKNVSAGMVYVESDSNWRVQNGVIHAPCDGLYLIYAQLQWHGGSPAHAIIEKRSESHDAKWPLGRMDSNHRLVTMSELRKGETIYLKLNQSDITSAADGILGIVLLNAEPNMKTCQENMYLTEERKPNLGRH
ncbi:uncharacterized protein LOC144597996 [Rhinoraja longicauda]